MFGRVTACCIAALLLFSPASSNGETRAFADLDLPKPANANTTMLDQARDRSDILTEDRSTIRSEEPSGDRNQDRTHDGSARTEIASLDPEMPAGSLPGPSQAPIAAPVQPFGLAVSPLTYGDVLTKWSGVEADIRAEKGILAHCREETAPCPREARRFLDIVAAGRAQIGRARIGVINRAINMAIRPMSDLEQWGVEDRWSAPLETMATGLGDCEDYAIAKYVALTEAGLAPDDVKLVIVRDPMIGEDHAVVTAHLDGTWIVLDNRWLKMVEDREMVRIVPLLELDGGGVKMFRRDMPPVARTASEPASLRF